MQADCLYPPGYDSCADLRLLKVKSHSGQPVRYYFIDFGLSEVYMSHQHRKNSVSPFGQYRDPPELSRKIVKPYDGFKLDVWCLGKMFQIDLLSVPLLSSICRIVLLPCHSGVYVCDFLEPLVSAMMQPAPEDRPTAEEAYAFLQEIRGSVSQDSTHVYRA